MLDKCLSDTGTVFGMDVRHVSSRYQLGLTVSVSLSDH